LYQIDDLALQVILYLSQVLDDGGIVNLFHPQSAKTVQDQGLHAYFAAAHSIVVIVIAYVDKLPGIGIGLLHGKVENSRIGLVDTDFR